MKKIIIYLFSLFSLMSYGQGKIIKLKKADLNYANEEKYPGAEILIGNVEFEHEGATLTCKQAFLYKKINFLKALGDVVIKQGDTITQTSDYTDYDGNSKQALSWGNVVVTDPKMVLTTDTLRYDRIKNIMYYTQYATIKDSVNVLKSKVGRYFLNDKKFTATTKVTVTNPEHILESDHLDYYTTTKQAFLYGPSTITGKDNTIYCEKGFYDTQTEISHFVKNAKLFFNKRTIEGDSLYYDRFEGFASATKNIIMIDTVQNFVAKGNYAEFFEKKDSLYIIDKAVGISIIEKDSMFVHGDTILVTGKPKKRVVRTYHDVKIFKSDLQGKCDSIHTSEVTGLTRMFKKPVLWAQKSQMTGDSIHFLTKKNNTPIDSLPNKTTHLKVKKDSLSLKESATDEKLDSLFIYGNALIIQKDSLGEDDFNQIKGRNMYGKFEKNRLRTLLVKGNAEEIFFNRDEKNILQTITKQQCSNIQFTLENNRISSINCMKPGNGEGNTFPPDEFPKEKRKLDGFIWRENERPKKQTEIFNKSNDNLIDSAEIKSENTTTPAKVIKNELFKIKKPTLKADKKKG